MEVVCDRFGCDVEGPLVVLDRFEKRRHRLPRLEVSDVVGDDGSPPFPHAERVLEFGSGGEYGPGEGRFHKQRLGGIATRPPDWILMTADDPDNRIVTPNVDGSVVRQEGIADWSQPAIRIVVRERDRFIRQVA
jgi:hypothetical protein